MKAIILGLTIFSLGCQMVKNDPAKSREVTICSNLKTTFDDSTHDFSATAVVDTFSSTVGIHTCSYKFILQGNKNASAVIGDSVSYFVDSYEWTVIEFRNDTLVIDKSTKSVTRNKLRVPKKKIIIKFQNGVIEYSPYLYYNYIQIFQNEVLFTSSQSPYA